MGGLETCFFFILLGIWNSFCFHLHIQKNMFQMSKCLCPSKFWYSYHRFFFFLVKINKGLSGLFIFIIFYIYIYIYIFYPICWSLFILQFFVFQMEANYSIYSIIQINILSALFRWLLLKICTILRFSRYVIYNAPFTFHV